MRTRNCLDRYYNNFYLVSTLKGRLKPGRMLLVDTVERVIIGDEELKLNIARSRPHSQWLDQLVTLDDLRRGLAPLSNGSSDAESNGVLLPTNNTASCADDIRRKLSLFNYTLETLTLLLVPMFTTK